MRVGGYGCYDVRTDLGRTTWYEAKQACAKMGKTLLAIEAEDENDAIKRFLEESEGISSDLWKENDFQWS